MSGQPESSASMRRASESGSGGHVQRGVSEFGELLGEMLARIPGARGAVLSDGSDDTIDTAHRTGDISVIDVCIAGAQVGQAMVRLTNDAVVFGLGRPQVLIETELGVMVSKLLFREYLLTMVLRRNANLARAMREFEQTAETIRRLLE
ncbi:roadblock/LC7 domain-containing protein [Nannocystaceae bacterium ST9]